MLFARDIITSHIKFRVLMRLGLVIVTANGAITGLVVDSDNLPNFNHNDRKVYVNNNWDNNRLSVIYSS